MTLTQRRALPWGALVLTAFVVACAADSPEDTTAGTGADTGSGGAEPGAACHEDAQCGGGGACLPPVFIPNGPKSCGVPCMVDADCDALDPADFVLEVDLESPTGDGNNVWNTTVLSRGTSCVAGQCQFLCPPYGAAAYDEDGVAAGCGCLPHFAFDDAGRECEWDANVACSIVERKDRPNPCNACNSEPLDETCESGRFQCLISTADLNGSCVEWIDDADVDACAMGSFGYECDSACYANCSAKDCEGDLCNVHINSCISQCCDSTDTPMPAGCDPGGLEDSVATCSDGKDNDGDGFADCDSVFPDADCCGVGSCGCMGGCFDVGLCGGGDPENNALTCTDQQDNDGDGFIDCDPNFPDTQCCGVGECGCNGPCAGQGQCA